MTKQSAVALVCAAAAGIGCLVSYFVSVPGVSPYYAGLGAAALVALIGGALISDEEKPDA